VRACLIEAAEPAIRHGQLVVDGGCLRRPLERRLEVRDRVAEAALA
jgi:hypothetical protein